MARSVKCRISQKHLGESKVTREKIELKLHDQKNQSAYLKTVLSQLELEIKDGGVLMALKNGLSSQTSFHKLHKNKKISKTFKFPSQKMRGISNQVHIDCL